MKHDFNFVQFSFNVSLLIAMQIQCFIVHHIPQWDSFLTYAKSLEAGQNQDAHYHRSTPPITGWLLSMGADSKQHPMCVAASKLVIEYYYY